MSVPLYAVLAAGLVAVGPPSESQGKPAPRVPPVAGSTVTLPLNHWTSLLEALRERPAAETTSKAPLAVASLRRSVVGTFRKGLLEATLTHRFVVLDTGGHLNVPVLDGAASPVEVTLDGKPASLVKTGTVYAVGIAKAGTYALKVRFYVGHEQDRFARQLKLALPAGGPTRVEVTVPETAIVPVIAGGALVSTEVTNAGTKVVGMVSADGALDLSWTRRTTHRNAAPLTMKAQTGTLFMLQESLVRGVAAFDFTLSDGETDRIDLPLPADVQVTNVSGDAVLQWRTTGRGRNLTVLLRHLVTDRVRMLVHFQYAADLDKGIPLRLPMPPTGVLFDGAAGVQAPAGIDVEVDGLEGARSLPPRDLPVRLTHLSEHPLLYGFVFSAAPEITLRARRQAGVTLTSTLIDEVEASTVLLADGGERTKLKLHIRNNTKQYLQVALPEGATLTHALVEGHPVRPARAGGRADAQDGGTLLFSLRQSERIDRESGRTHTVQTGETLGNIALRYYSDPGKWRALLEANSDTLPSEHALRVGQVLKIPSVGPVLVEESTFVLEIAYQRRLSTFSWLGKRELALPDLDVDAVKVTWHVYLPKAVTPLVFDGNVTQLTRIRYGTFRRFEQFLDSVFGVEDARAGTKKYKSILKRRKGIYHAEASRKDRGDVAPGNFPLVGSRYRFKRLLASTGEAPTISIFYASDTALQGLRWLALLASVGLALLLLARRRVWWKPVLALVGFAALLLAAHYVIGIHKRMLWGTAIALAIALWRLRDFSGGVSWKDVVNTPLSAWREATPNRLIELVGMLLAVKAMLMLPVLIPITLTLGLGVLWYRWDRRFRRVDHV